jgi:hypothetical protein
MRSPPRLADWSASRCMLVVDTTKDTAGRRWLWNLLLFYAITLAVGIILGLFGAAGEDRFNQGVDATIVYQAP